jgi:hypothetical protein
MSLSLGKGLAIAAGLGAVGIGGMMLLKGGGGSKETEGADPATDPGAGGMTGPPTGTTMATDPMAGTAGSALAGSGGMTGMADPTGSMGMGMDSGMGMGPATGTTAGSAQSSPMGTTAAGQGQQVGPYTVVPDPQSGLQIVFETATQQPVGVVDEQGNVTPITVDANGNLALAQEQPTASALGRSPSMYPGVSASSGQGGAVASASMASMPTTSSQRSAVYDQIAYDLFANAANPAIGSAQSDPMSGAAYLTPAPTGYQDPYAASSSAPMAAADPYAASYADPYAASSADPYASIPSGSSGGYGAAGATGRTTGMY